MSVGVNLKDFQAQVASGAIGSTIGPGGGQIYKGGGGPRSSNLPPVHNNIVKRAGMFGYNLLRNPFNLRRAVTTLALPTTAAEAGIADIGAAGIGRGIIKAGSGLKNLFLRAVANPFAGTTLKGGLAKIGGRALGALTAVEAFSLSKSAITGQPYSPLLSRAKLKDVAAFGLNPIGGVAGIFGGLGTEGTKKIIDIFKPGPMSIPQIPTIPKDIFPELPSTNQYFNLATPSAMSTPYASYTAPSLSVSTGGGGINPAELALLVGALGLGGGYLLGRRKRRKKARYKKRKKH